MSNQETYEKVRELKRIIAQQYGLAEGYDHYFFLARIGSNYNKYGFNWEPFRDLAGPLGIGEGSLLILIVSDEERREAPEQSKVDVPTPHYQIRVSPSLSALAIANMWLELLVDDQAFHSHYQGPFDWFIRGLGIRADEVSEKARAFLKL